ncbi:hypothetical protein [Pseudoalteromonas luteoviolacea]|uniref:Uncharacterized protein n=1 Tax=Pseudoalteromonas luteoviolacea S4060-1 TaxID=1365257 RepID=A0A167N6N3_9GAMM|nr:hypothetical protein [Pseudoalteromonas luteoviolacea]KZN67585.1 hypothetical protein N478_02180 [Pseudoalteromonas luteoviolacea S4060-1]
MEVVAQKPYCWTLLRDGSKYLFSAVQGGHAMTSREITLITREIQLYETYGEAILDDLAKQVNQNPHAFNARTISNFRNDDRVSEAFAAWHRKKSTD